MLATTPAGWQTGLLMVEGRERRLSVTPNVEGSFSPSKKGSLMFEGTELLSYALMLFLMYVYLPYTFFKFSAERSIDLGKRRDFTQLEEIISAFVPTICLHAQAIPVYLLVNKLRHEKWTIDFSVMASMFGSDRGAVSDYIYAGSWYACVLYLGILWAASALNGWWFGRAVRTVARDPHAVHGIDMVWGKRKSVEFPFYLKPPWWLWYPFFHESIVPLFTWASSTPYVRIETTDHRIYYGKFMRYEKTTDGRLDAIRLAGAGRSRWITKKGKDGDQEGESHRAEIGTIYLKWAQISDIVVIEDSHDESLRQERRRKQDDWVLRSARLSPTDAPTANV